MEYGIQYLKIICKTETSSSWTISVRVLEIGYYFIPFSISSLYVLLVWLPTQQIRSYILDQLVAVVRFLHR